MQTLQNALSTNAEEIITASASGAYYREIKNIDAAITIYLGGSTAVTAANGYPLAPGDTFGIVGNPGSVWAIAASGTPSIAIVEW